MPAFVTNQNHRTVRLPGRHIHGMRPNFLFDAAALLVQLVKVGCQPGSLRIHPALTAAAPPDQTGRSARQH
jgi:hypothetical protein